MTDVSIQAIAPADDRVYIGGEFHEVGPRTGAGVALSRANGNLLPGLAEVGAVGVDAVVRDGAGGWYIGGSFQEVDGIPRGQIAHIFPDGRVDPAFDPRAPAPAATHAPPRTPATASAK